MKIITATISGFNDDRGVRQTKVENKNTLFSPPKQSITEYLESKH